MMTRQLKMSGSLHGVGWVQSGAGLAFFPFTRTLRQKERPRLCDGIAVGMHHSLFKQADLKKGCVE